MFKKSIIPVLLTLALAPWVSPVIAATVGLCDVTIPTPQPPATGSNPNVNVDINTCDIDDSEIVEASLSGGSPFPIAPVVGTDSAAVDAALIEAAAALGMDPATLEVVMLALLTESVDLVEEVFATSSNTPPVQGVDYIGDPDDYSSWIAIGPLDVEVVISQATVLSRTYRLDLAERVPLPATALLLLAGLGGLMVRRARPA